MHQVLPTFQQKNNRGELPKFPLHSRKNLVKPDFAGKLNIFKIKIEFTCINMLYYIHTFTHLTHGPTYTHPAIYIFNLNMPTLLFLLNIELNLKMDHQIRHFHHQYRWFWKKKKLELLWELLNYPFQMYFEWY